MTVSYTEDLDYRMRTVFAILALMSIGFASVLQAVLPDHPRFVAPFTLMAFASLFWLFDAVLWKLPVIRLLNSGIPNLAGSWNGTLMRVADGVTHPIEAQLEIRQTWSKLNLVLKTEEAVSRSKMAGFVLKNRDEIILTWIFQKDARKADYLLEPGRGIIEVTLRKTVGSRSLKGATMTGSFITSGPGEPLQLAFEKPGPFYWNPKPF